MERWRAARLDGHLWRKDLGVHQRLESLTLAGEVIDGSGDKRSGQAEDVRHRSSLVLGSPVGIVHQRCHRAIASCVMHLVKHDQREARQVEVPTSNDSIYKDLGCADKDIAGLDAQVPSRLCPPTQTVAAELGDATCVRAVLSAHSRLLLNQDNGGYDEEDFAAVRCFCCCGKEMIHELHSDWRLAQAGVQTDDGVLSHPSLQAFHLVRTQYKRTPSGQGRRHELASERGNLVHIAQPPKGLLRMGTHEGEHHRPTIGVRRQVSPDDSKAPVSQRLV